MRVLWLFLLVACDASPPDDKPPAERCDNIEDDDLDGLADCADPDCASVCGEVCTNGADDDGDGLIDCRDDQCDGACPEHCSDGRDNDGDGQVDCDDRDCVGSCPEVCGDGFDNDGDGKVDCLDEECVDPTCRELCDDGRDNDADGLVDCADPDCDDPVCAEACDDGRDNDADGRVDCNDPDCDGACPEVCDDGRDNDADGDVDCDDRECEAVCDADGDGFDTAALGGDDCDDTRADVNPGRPEICNGDEVLDDDCDGLFDEDDPDIDPLTLEGWTRDADGDGYGGRLDGLVACHAPDGFGRALPADCDDARPDVNPGMPEICNVDAPLDDDCDGLVDDDDPDITEDSLLEWFADADGDGYGSMDALLYACSRPEGAAPSDDDCDDADPAVGPPTLWYADGDGDGHGAGDPIDPTPTCEPPVDGLFPEWFGLDCDDADPTVHPSALEVCENGIDEDCDGADDPCAYPCDLGWPEPFDDVTEHAENYLLGHPLRVPADTWVLGLALHAVEAGTGARMALYTDTLGEPDALVVGSDPDVTPVGVLEHDVPDTLIPPGEYWLMANYETTAYIAMSPDEGHDAGYIRHDFDAPLPGRIAGPTIYTTHQINYWIVGECLD